MPLFEITRRTGKALDRATVAKAKKVAVAPPVRKGTDILSRINEIKATVEQHLGKFRNEYILITEEAVLVKYIDACIAQHYISIDTETDGLDPLRNTLAGICIYTRGQAGAYIPLNHISYITNMRIDGQLDMEFVMSQFKRLLAVKPDIDMFNAKFDIRFLRANGLPEIYCTWDGMLASFLMNENEPTHGLKALHKKYILHGEGDAFSFDSLFSGIPFTMVPYTTGYLYAAHDPVITTELCDFQRQYLTPGEPKCTQYELEDVAWVFHNIEMPCVSVVADMEDNGITFDLDYCQELSVKYNAAMQEKLSEFHTLCNSYPEIDKYRITHVNSKLENPINIASATQLAILFYDILGLDPVDKNSLRGTGEEILKKFNHPLGNVVLQYRELAKLVSTYIDKMPACVNPNDGRIHCSFHQYGAKTGRFSSSDPNLQNIPSHNKDIRKMFTASPGYVLMSSDYSQQEPKVMTQMCGDKKMLQAYKEGKDLYAQIAAIAFNTDYENCLEFRPDGTTNPEGKARRSSAKSILLGILYGRGINSVAEQLNTTKQKAQLIQDKIFKGFPAIQRFEKDSKDMALDMGFVTTLWGRKRRLPDLSLPEFEFSWKNGAPPDDDLLDFSEDATAQDAEVPAYIKSKYVRKLQSCWGAQKRQIIQEAEQDGIRIQDNGAKIADAERQVVNSRIQGSAADMSKLAMIAVGKDARLKELGFRLLIPVHDELIAECPLEHAVECRDRFAMLMSKAAGDRLTVPISCDVEVTERWYGERVNI